MAKHKILYWRPDMDRNGKGELYANVHLLIGYNQGSLVDFRKMADELRETFPQATDEEICGGKVFKSRQVNSFTIITWAGYLPAGDYPGWEVRDNGQMEYCW